MSAAHVISVVKRRQ